MSGIDRLKDANRYEMKLENGIPITYRLPFMEELVVARLLPLTLLDELRKRMTEGGTTVEAESTAERAMEERLTDYESDFEAKQRVVALMVTEIDGEPAELTPEDTIEIPVENFRQLVSIAMRQEPAKARGKRDDPRALADFIASPDGEIYGRYCAAYGKDPGAIFSDDVIAFQVGLAYMVRDSFTNAPAEESASDHPGEFRDEDIWRG
jgi:hypothetical protein